MPQYYYTMTMMRYTTFVVQSSHTQTHTGQMRDSNYKIGALPIFFRNLAREITRIRTNSETFTCEERRKDKIKTLWLVGHHPIRLFRITH